MRADVKAVRRAINKNTILIVGSACAYPHGTVDPIREMAALAQEYGVGFHSDCCLGGFILPFLKKNGHHEIPDFDFSVPGVTSISADLHKYGNTFKGSSVILYANENIRHAMFFVHADWMGGMYPSATLSGSRPGALIACTWAAILSIGQEGYVQMAEKIYDTAMKIKQGISKIPHLHLVGDSRSSVVAYGSRHIDVFKVTDVMKTKGWRLNNLQNPVCVHILIASPQAGKAEEFLRDLRESVEEVSKSPKAPILGGSAAMYGMAAAFPDRGTVAELATTYLDAVLSGE